ncbi:MAG: hypothetical protein Q7S44_02970, partial [bacterium]|nr:hypothetical protein [bacterium]
MKYDAQISGLTPALTGAQNILIALPSEVNVDLLASGLALYLSLEQAGKKAAIATEGIIRVEHTNLFGVGKISNTLPASQGGNFTISLGGVVGKDASGQSIVPALEKLDWAPQGLDLKLVFHVLP